MELKFEKFGKIGRLNKTCTITEKVDGTNSQIVFDYDGNFLVGSRRREIFPNGTDGKPKGCDNAGFALWVHENHDELFNYLGEGRHFGEWAGRGLKESKRYKNLNEKRFYLFNSFRFGRDDNPIPTGLYNRGLDVVPILYEGDFDSAAVEDVMYALRQEKSSIDGFSEAEGIVIYHHGLQTYAKITFEYDKGKWSKEE